MVCHLSIIVSMISIACKKWHVSPTEESFDESEPEESDKEANPVVLEDKSTLEAR